MVRLLESVGPLVAVKPADHLRFGGRRGRCRIAFFPVGWGGPDSGGVLWPAVRRCSPRPGYHGCAGPGAMMTVRARAAGVLIAVVLAAAAAGCTGDVQQVPASSAPAPATPGTSKGSVSSAGGTGSGSVEDRAARSDQLLASMVAADQPGCSAAVAIDGQVVWAGARGLANLEQKTPLTTATRFDIASVSKQFTATAILLLSFDGALTLQDPVSQYVPGLPAWADQVTLDQLIHHTSGIPDYDQQFTTSGISYQTPTTQQDAIRAIAGMTELNAPPGATFEYSNSNYVLLAEVAAAASGTSLPDLLRRRVFDPLGLNMQLHPALQAPDVATGYWTINGTLTPEVVRWMQVGDGSIYTTPSELVRWADNYRTAGWAAPNCWPRSPPTPSRRARRLNRTPCDTAPGSTSPRTERSATPAAGRATPLLHDHLHRPPHHHRGQLQQRQRPQLIHGPRRPANHLVRLNIPIDGTASSPIDPPREETSAHGDSREVSPAR